MYPIRKTPTVILATLNQTRFDGAEFQCVEAYREIFISALFHAFFLWALTRVNAAARSPRQIAGSIRGGVMSKAKHYREQAAEHARLAQLSDNEMAREMHTRIRDSFLALAHSEEWLAGLHPPQAPSPHPDDPVRRATRD